MPMKMKGDFEIVDYRDNRSVVLYDNQQYEEYPLHWHNAIEITMAVEEPYLVMSGGEDFLLEEGEMLIIPAGTLHHLKAQEGRRMFFLINNDAISGNPALTAISGFLNKPLYLNKNEDETLLKHLTSIMKDIHKEYSHFDSVSEVSIYIKVVTMLLDIIKYKLKDYRKSSTDNYADSFGIIIKYIEDNYMNEITLDDLAELSGYSKFYFCKMFSRYTGSTLPDFINRRRIVASEFMLSDEELKITDIAMRVGFSSITTFNRAFRKINGCTPSEFRKLHRTLEHYNTSTSNVMMSEVASNA